MKRLFLRNLVSLVLSLVLVGTSVASAFARGQAPAVLHVVICTDGGTETLALDARGNPVNPLPHCPECTLAVAAILPPVASVCGNRIQGASHARQHEEAVLPKRLHLFAEARAPPVPA